MENGQMVDKKEAFEVLLSNLEEFTKDNNIAFVLLAENFQDEKKDIFLKFSTNGDILEQFLLISTLLNILLNGAKRDKRLLKEFTDRLLKIIKNCKI